MSPETENGVISRVKTCLMRLWGGKVATMTSSDEPLRVGANNDVERADNTIFNLDDLVKKRAWYLYTFDKRYKRFFFERKPCIDLDWSNVVFKADIPKYTKISAGENENRITSKTVVQNKSKEAQHHTLRAKRQTTVLCSSSLTAGCIIGSNVALSIKAPTDLGVSTNFSIQTAEENSKEDKFAWVVEDLIKIPKHSSIDVSMILKQQEQEYFFKTNVEIQGSVRVRYYNKQKETTGIYDIPISTLIMEEFPGKVTYKTVDNKTVYWIQIQGKCKFKHAMDEIVIMPQTSQGQTSNDED